MQVIGEFRIAYEAAETVYLGIFSRGTYDAAAVFIGIGMMPLVFHHKKNKYPTVEEIRHDRVYFYCTTADEK